MEAKQNAPAARAVGERTIDLARSRFFAEGRQPEAGVSPAILESWLRCRDLGLDTASRVAAEKRSTMSLISLRSGLSSGAILARRCTRSRRALRRGGAGHSWACDIHGRATIPL